jgi:predicted DNA-binding transcriptional regulator YafY
MHTIIERGKNSWSSLMRLDKSRQLLKLALMMQASIEGVGLQEIQQEFEVGRRTAERMRDAVLQLFLHTEELRVDGKTKRWRLPASALAGLIHISAEDLAEMKTAIDLLRKEHLVCHADNLEQLWLKIKGRLRPETAASIETDLEVLLETECHAVRPGPRPHINPNVLYILREAIKAFCKVRLTYNSRTKGGATERVVHPYGFVYGLRHYLIVWCEAAKGLRAFSLPNIAEIIIIQTPYLKDPTFNLQEYATRSFGVFKEEPYEVAWRFSATVTDAVREHHFHPSQRIEEQPDGSLIVRFKAGGWKEMCWSVMAWEGHAEILEPAHLRQSYNEMVQHLHTQAGK